jgi:hypothetical protein
MFPFTPMMILELCALGVDQIDPRKVEGWMAPRQRENPRALGLAVQGLRVGMNLGELPEGGRGRRI